MKSFISTKAKKGLESKIHGRGIFSIESIAKGELIAIKKGRILSGKELQETGLNSDSHAELQIDIDKYVSPANKNEFEDSMIFINHSCDPNVGMSGDVNFIAIRDIQSGEELTVDYAMIDDNNSKMECKCKSLNCRKLVTGKDWEIQELENRYKGFFSNYIQEKIDAREGASW